jgi:Tfp pilus tip-associated adhesin PilY1
MTNTFRVTTYDSLSSPLRHCEERSSLNSKNQCSLNNSQKKRVTKQSPFTNQLTRDFYNAYKNHSSTKSEQGDCFADSFTANVANIKSFTTLRLAMTNVDGWVGSLRNVDLDEQKQKSDFVGCVLRTATRLVTTNDANCKRCGGALSAPYTLTARFV